MQGDSTRCQASARGNVSVTSGGSGKYQITFKRAPGGPLRAEIEAFGEGFLEGTEANTQRLSRGQRCGRRHD